MKSEKIVFKDMITKPIAIILAIGLLIFCLFVEEAPILLKSILCILYVFLLSNQPFNDMIIITDRRLTLYYVRDLKIKNKIKKLDIMWEDIKDVHFYNSYGSHIVFRTKYNMDGYTKDIDCIAVTNKRYKKIKKLINQKVAYAKRA